MIPDNPLDDGPPQVMEFHLDQKTLPRVPCRNAQGIEILDQSQALHDLVFGPSRHLADFLDRYLEITVVIQISDDLDADFLLKVVGPTHVQLSHEVGVKACLA